MVSTKRINPAPLLQPFVSGYALRTFDTGQMELRKYMHAVQESYMTLFLKDKFCEVRNDSDELLGSASSTIVALLTESKGYSCFKGNFELFCVQFRCNGLFAIFGIPQKTLIDTIIPVEAVLGNEINLLIGELASSKNIFEMTGHMDAYLLRAMSRQKHKSYTKSIAYSSELIEKDRGNFSLNRMAHNANMSFRNFERRFADEVGMPPKLYARITRFNSALEHKVVNPGKKWSDIVHEYGYFDQAHFIKEVKAFSSKAPDELFRNVSPAAESDINKLAH
ncbi:MAG TPA: helix-turn-helix domain-containing protein [Agriterribacter sp.]|nr:helix-turn-helix domain-containing protein [Agriterribacter sp.]